MGKRQTTLVGIAVGLTLFFAVNVLSNTTLRSWRLDMTDQKLFTLTEGSRNIAADVEETIRLKMYVSGDAIDKVPSLKSHAQRVEEMLEEYVLASKGTIELDVIDPEPYSDAETEALGDGLYAATVGSGLDKLYFGLVATNAVGDKELIAFLDPSSERFLEYEISRLIYSLDNPQRTIVGVLSSLDLAGGAVNPMAPQAPRAPRWRLLDYLDSLFETRNLQDGIDAIPADVDVLLLVHPKGFSDATRYAVDQYVLGGGEAVVCVDPWCDVDPSGQDPSNPFGGMSADKTSHLPELLAAWGLELVPGRVAADRQNALEVMTNNRGAQERWPFVVWIGAKGDAYDADDAITSSLDQVNLATAGILRQTGGATTTFSPLIQTSEDSMDIDLGAVQFQTPPKDLFQNFVSLKQRFTLAARVTGPATSAFPGGRPSADPDAEAPVEDTGHLADGQVQIVVVADADFLHERFWLRDTFFFGYEKTADNGDLITNAIENLAGGEDLIAIRGRGQFARPFDRVEEIRRQANEEYLSEERLLQQKMTDAESRINELIQQENPGKITLTPEIEVEVARVRAEMADTNRQLRDVHYNLGKDIERLGNILKWLNIGLLPALVSLTAIVLGTAGKSRRRKR